MVDSCGRVRRVQVLVDELCGPSPDLDLLRVPMFRDGALIEDRLFAVDATHLWTLDITDPTAPVRAELTSGLGTPLAVAQHRSQLLIAAGNEGLIVASSSSALAVDHRVSLPGPAIDVATYGNSAYVAAGDAGLLGVRLDGGAPALESFLALDGYAVAVSVTASTAYVASCQRTWIIDLPTMTMVGSVEFDRPVSMKDVAAEGDRLFIAAGTLGALEVDISDRTSPVVLGACTAGEPNFYASGVKVTEDRLLVAGGEWGILDSDRTSTCPPLPPPPDSQRVEDCSIVAPWVVVTVPPPDPPPAPPPANRDPVQVLYRGDLVLGFGDARRIGIRAIDFHDANRTIHDDSNIGRYQQPSAATRIAVSHDRLAVIGEENALYARTKDGWQLEIPFNVRGIDVGFLDDGRWVLLLPRTLEIEGEPTYSLPEPASGRLAIDGDRIAIPALEGIMLYDAESRSIDFLGSPEPASFSPAVAITAAGVVMGSPDWASSLDVMSGTWLSPHRAFDTVEVADYERWVGGPPRRLLLATPHGLFEAASFDGRSLGVLHHPRDVATVPLGPTTLTAAASSGDRVYLVAGDSGTYRSELITLSVAEDRVSVLRSIGFTGVAVDVAVDGDRVYVADTDSGIRTFEVEP